MVRTRLDWLQVLEATPEFSGLQASLHPVQQHQVVLATGSGLMTQESDQRNMQVGKGCHESTRH
jgi:hypothetical protein